MNARRMMLLWVLATGLVLFGAAVPVYATDSDGDGVDDEIDVCNNTPAGAAVDGEGRPLGDTDQDCDTDLDDYALFQQGFTGPLAAYVWIDTVTVGNPCNDGELSGGGAGGSGPDRICGAVAYTYNIGKYEVTAEQYCRFLNAVADTDTYGLYNTLMWSSEFGCKIERTGSSGSYTYSVADDWADRPVNYVSWGDAARFANWLHNGQPTGAQDLTTTEDGSYYLGGAMSDAELLAVTRQPDASCVIPSEDEWYKAAYHYNDGVTGNYWDYPTESDTAPSCEVPPGTDMTNGSANYYCSGWVIGSPYYRNEVGAYDAKPSDSPYGTFDQGGNVWEWNEAVIELYRGVRGASFNDIDNYLRAAVRESQYPTDEHWTMGFRVAEAFPMVIDTVPVGNPGNDWELSGEGAGGSGPDRFCGAVPYTYNIGKYEVTAEQYCRFLNAVAATDTYDLYNTNMWSDPWGCKIKRTGSSGSYTYSVAADWAHRPVNFVNWGDAARFANWLFNGQRTGAQDFSTTEGGSYYLNGAMSEAELMAVWREPLATWVIPSEDEWYKAAYHYNDGVTGNYWDYPTESDTAPTSEAPPGTDMTNGSANYLSDGWAVGSPYYRNEVGAYDAKPSDSPYGTFDQGGNVSEWVEARFYGVARGVRGGSFSDHFDYLHAADRYYMVPDDHSQSFGFRVAEVP